MRLHYIAFERRWHGREIVKHNCWMATVCCICGGRCAHVLHHQHIVLSATRFDRYIIFYRITMLLPHHSVSRRKLSEFSRYGIVRIGYKFTLSKIPSYTRIYAAIYIYTVLYRRKEHLRLVGEMKISARWNSIEILH